MDTSIAVALITVAGGALLTIAGSVIAFVLTKRHEIKTESRKEKIYHYKVLFCSLSDLAVDGKDKEKANENFSLAVNTIGLVAPQAVVQALMEYHDYIKYSNKNQTPEGHDKLLNKLLLAIREDINISPKDDPETFRFHMMGTKPPNEK